MTSRKILVTGGAGFIGSHLCRALVARGDDVSVLVKYRSINDCVRLSPVWDRITVLEGDLRNADSLRQFHGRAYDIVFHLAAYNHVGNSFLHVSEALASNLQGTANLLEMGPAFGRFLYMSTSECYGYQERVPFQEEATPFPISPYAVGKYAGELYSRMKRRQDPGAGIVCVRAFNTYGPWQGEGAVIPELIIRCLRGLAIETTEGRQTREFNFVEDIVAGLMLAASAPPFEGIVNLGSNREVAIADLVRMIHALSGSSSELRIGALPYRPTEIWRMCADNGRAAELLGWRPRVGLEEGLAATIAWFRRYLDLFYGKDSALNRL